ncbi:MAG: glycosyltransferase family 2 protein [Candidatus Saccharibacteria bacterium]|nr:glycosyltransferase family 2 protein [Microbacteriaceae bacterium]
MSVAGAEVSVALCTHNGERFIAEQLASILSQSILPGQIVISDDASTDSTLAVVAETVDLFTRRHPDAAVEITIERNRVALGVAANFEQAIRSCRGELIALCDQDDLWAPDRLRRIIDEFGAHPALVLIHSDARLIDGSGRALPASLFEALEIDDRMVEAEHDGHAFESLMKRNTVTGATTVIRRSLARTAMPFPQPWLHDEWLAVVGAATGEVDVLEEKLVDYRQHDLNQIGASRLSLLGNFRRLLEPGSQRNERLLARARVLLDRLGDLDVAPERVEAARSKVAHEQARSALPAARFGRIWPIIRELRTGRYGSFGRGLSDAVRDLLQPLGPSG